MTRKIFHEVVFVVNHRWFTHSDNLLNLAIFNLCVESCYVRIHVNFRSMHFCGTLRHPIPSLSKHRLGFASLPAASLEKTHGGFMLFAVGSLDPFHPGEVLIRFPRPNVPTDEEDH